MAEIKVSEGTDDRQLLLSQIDELCSLSSTKQYLGCPFVYQTGSAELTKIAEEKKVEMLTLMNHLFRKLDVSSGTSGTTSSGSGSSSRWRRLQCATLFIDDYSLWCPRWQRAAKLWLSQLWLKEEYKHSFICTLVTSDVSSTSASTKMVVEIEYDINAQFGSVNLYSISIADDAKKSTLYVASSSSSYLDEDSLDNFFALYSKITCVGDILPFNLWINLIRGIILSLSLLSFRPEDKVADKLIACHLWFSKDRDNGAACSCLLSPKLNVYYVDFKQGSIVASAIADDLAKITIADDVDNDGWISVKWDRLLIDYSDRQRLTNWMKEQVPKRIFESLIKSSCGQYMVNHHLAKVISRVTGGGMLLEVNKDKVYGKSLSINISTDTIAFQLKAHGARDVKIDLRLESPYAYETDIVHVSKRQDRRRLNQLLLSRGKKPQARKLKSELSLSRPRLPDTLVGGYHNEVIYFLKLYVLTVVEVLLKLSAGSSGQISGQVSGQLSDIAEATTLGSLSKLDQVIPLPGPLIGIIFDYVRDEHRLEELDDLIWDRVSNLFCSH